MQQTNQNLMAAIARGNTAAFSDLYDAVGPRLFGLIVKVLGTRRDAEDVLQEVFREVWTRADRYDPALGSPEAWLLILARSRAIDHLRRRRSEKSMIDAQLATGSGDGTSQSDALPLATSTRSGLAALPVDQGDAVQLAFYRGLTCEQIAHIQAVPLGTAKTRLRLGLQKLRDILAPPETCNR